MVYFPIYSKIVAQLGMDVTGDVFELQCSLIEYLKKKKQQGASKAGGSATGGKSLLLLNHKI